VLFIAVLLVLFSLCEREYGSFYEWIYPLVPFQLLLIFDEAGGKKKKISPTGRGRERGMKGLEISQGSS